MPLTFTAEQPHNSRRMRLAPNDAGRDLYVIQASDGHVKIGRSDNPEKRLADLQAAQVHDLVLVFTAPSDGWREAELLRLVERHRLRGEWLNGSLSCRREIERFIGTRIAWPYNTSLAQKAGAPSDTAAAHSTLRPKDAAALCGVSLPAFWAAVRNGRLPSPMYPAPRAPRWFEAELRAALEATRALPRDAQAARRAAAIKQAEGRA